MGQRFAVGQAQLQLHQVQAGHCFGDGMFHLQAGIDFQKHEGRAADQELPGAQAAIGHGLRHALCRLFQRRRAGGVGWRGFHQLLMAALHAAIARAKANCADAVGRDLHLYVPGVLDGALGEHRAVAEEGERLRGGLGPGGVQIGMLAHEAHAAPAATCGRLQQNGACCQECRDCIRRACRFGYGHAVFRGEGPGAALVATNLQNLSRRAHEHNAGGGTGARQDR